MARFRHRGTILAFALVVGGCSGGPEEAEVTELLVENESSSGLHDVTGTAPQAVGSFPSVVIFEPVQVVPSPVPEKATVMDQYGTAFFPPV